MEAEKRKEINLLLRNLEKEIYRQKASKREREENAGRDNEMLTSK